MANVFFTRGLHANLPTSGTAAVVDGTFYLTTDTHRLYVAQGTNLVELNKSITSVAAVSDLPTTGVAEGQFYYATTENVLCYYNGSGWTQINPDTRLLADNDNTSVTAGTNAATVTSEVKEALNSGARTSSGSFTIKGDSNLNVTVSGHEITLAPNIRNITSNVNTRYTVSTDDHTGGGADIKLTSSDTTPIVDSVAIVGSGAAGVTQANDVITVNVAQPVATTEAGFGADGVLTIDTSVNSQSSNADTVTPIIKLGGTANDNLDANGYKFVGSDQGAVGTVTLPVYTKKETEERINAALSAADAMTYKGTVTSADAATKLVSTANVGDTYKVAENISTPYSAKIGDLIIANGSDGNVSWEVVPSGDDQAINAEISELGLSVKDGNIEIGGINIAAGTHITATGSYTDGDTSTTITIAQKDDYTAQNVAGSADNVTQSAGGQSAGTATFEAITAIQTDVYGNVVNGSIQKKQFTVTDTHNKLEEIEISGSATNNVATITVGASDADRNTITSGSFSIGSDNLTITSTSAGAITANLEWGTFGTSGS